MDAGLRPARHSAPDCCAVMTPAALRTTPFTQAHQESDARLVPFAGYSMPLHYPTGGLAEHRWTRAHAGLFDVSHMGVAFLTLESLSSDGEADHRRIARLVEPLVCGDLQSLRPGQLRYSLMLDRSGGILDDVMIGRPADPAGQGTLYLVVNAATKEQDFALIATALGASARIDRRGGYGLLALQGPDAASVLESLCAGVSRLAFMRFARLAFAGAPLWISRSGYSGEDGFEILVPPAAANGLWDRLRADARVRPVGLGARDSLRLEAGLPLYGHELDPSVSPIEAGLRFAVSRRRHDLGDIRGAARLAHEISEGPARIRVGVSVLEGAPARAGTIIAHQGETVGIVTSGGFSPTLGLPIALGFVPPALALPDTDLQVIVRGRTQRAEVVALPFVPHRYVRNP